MRYFQQIINYFAAHPKTLFLIDGIGALLSAFMLGGVLASLESTFGMPAQVLYGLALVAGVFALYSLFCYFRIPGNWRPFLKIIAIANLIYCLATIGLVIHHYQALTALGLAYFLLELIIVLTLVTIELKTASNRFGGL